MKRARVNGATYTGKTWVEVINTALMAAGARSRSDERRDAARALERGVSTVIAGMVIKPEGSRE